MTGLPRITGDEAARLVRLAAVVATSPPRAGMLAIASALPDLLGAGSTVACVFTHGSGRAAAPRTLYAAASTAERCEDLVGRVSALGPASLEAKPLLARARSGQGTIVALAAPLPAGGHVVLAVDRPRGARRFTARDRVLLAVLAPLVTQVVQGLQVRSLDALTPRELQVAQHAARGLGDREIAQALEIGFATVRTHLQRAFVKLSVSSRTELASLTLADGVRPPRRRPAERRGGRRRARGR